jgi:flagellar hook-basal body complex protein FliE
MRTEFIKPAFGGGLKAESLLRQQDPQQNVSFVGELKKTLEQVDGRQKQADGAMTKAAHGGPEQIHETMINVEEAEVSMRLLLKVRTKVLDAYQEIMRMQF